MNVSAYSIRNPLVAILLFILLTMGGLFAFKQMKIQQFPDIDFPGVVVTVTLPGAAPAQLENDIAKPLENKLASIEGLKHMRTTLQTGAVTIHSEFKLEKDIQEAVDDVRSAVNEARGNLPAAANEPIITKVSTAGFPVVTYSVSAKNMSVSDLSWYVDDTLNKRLSDIQGVGKINRIGGVTRIITVHPDVGVLNSLKMPISKLSEQIFATQQDSTGGESKIGNSNQTIRVLGAAQSIDDLHQLQITTPQGQALTLSSFSQIKDNIADPTSLAKLNQDTVVAFNVMRARGASEVDIVNAIDAEIAKIKQSQPNIQIEKVYDRSQPVHDDYKASMQMLIEGTILAVLVVYLFLRNWRATFVAAVALPLSIIPTFLAMYLFNFSLNIISLLALSLVIGVLVDDAIVEVENIMRHLRMGKTPYEAAMEAADEIGLAVIATTFTLIAVFLPTAFMSGVVGQFFKQFGWTAALAIFVSLLVARLITPMMAAYILKPEPNKIEKIGHVMRNYLGMVKWTLNYRWLTLFVTLLLFVGSLSLAGRLPNAFIPPDDTSETRVAIELTPDATIHDTARIADLAYQQIIQVEGVEKVLTSIGTSGASMDSRSAAAGTLNTASLDIVLKPRHQRPDKTKIEKQILEQLQKVPSARFTVGLSAGGESGYSFSLTSNDPVMLDQTATRLIEEIRGLSMVAEVSSNKSLPKPELQVIPNRMALADQGVTTMSLADTLRIATQGDYDQRLAKLNLDTRQLPIIVRLPDENKQDINALSQLYVPSQRPEGVKIGDVAELNYSAGAAEMRRFDRERAIKITVHSNNGQLGDLVKAVKSTPTMKNLSNSITVIDEGQAESMKELFTGFVIAMAVGIFCIFGVLILLFHKVLQPFTILMALPLSIGGAFIGLIVTNSSLSMPSMIGFIMLMGIATKNSILLVDYAITAETEHGLNRTEAILDACRKRARPIIMTTIAMGAGMLPLVFGWGGADPTFRQPMAAAVLGGLITSTFLSLVVIPVVYTLMDDLSGFFRRNKAVVQS
ncbi:MULTISPECIES: efflux RND transporter permease subunit [unclassified Acinetobacter]|uniref:efflux RND transporter permease subunit n=1 Tax=unclassified Acinetobacter TaxID=196816 RepID=UPI0035B898A2